MTACVQCGTGSVGHRSPSPRILARVEASARLGSLVWLTLEAPGWRASRPGQFALLQPEPSRSFLARALSVADEVGDRVSFLVAPVGEGSRELCGLAPGAAVWVLGPLGNGFDIDDIGEGGRSRLLIVAGGVGVAPFPLLLSRLAHRVAGVSASEAPAGAPAQRPLEVVLLLGFRDALQAQGAAPVIEAASRSREAGLSCRFAVAVEDGSRGPAEKVTDLLARELLPGDSLFVCGPTGMAAAVWRACSSLPEVEAWFSLEAGMACGVGSCHGCALTLADGSLARVCREGPVFSGERVFGSSTSRRGLPERGEKPL